ncbi:hypothetical protein EIP86_009361 [Pleurotus ostreatoroseus]|nr:hypothetical protein EIP86_009361 [Pleurotus ostreatoroseus]
MTTSEHVPSPPTAPGEASHSSPSARAEEAFVQVPPSTSREPHSATPTRSPLPNSPHTPGAQTSGTVPQPRSTDGSPRSFKLPSWMNVLEENGTSLMYMTDDNAELARKGLWNDGSSNYKMPLVFQAVEEVVQQTKKMKAKELVIFVE